MTECVTTVMKLPGCTVRIHKPILSAEERARRYEEIKKAMVEVKKELIRNAIARGESI